MLCNLLFFYRTMKRQFLLSHAIRQLKIGLFIKKTCLSKTWIAKFLHFRIVNNFCVPMATNQIKKKTYHTFRTVYITHVLSHCQNSLYYSCIWPVTFQALYRHFNEKLSSVKLVLCAKISLLSQMMRSCKHFRINRGKSIHPFGP